MNKQHMISFNRVLKHFIDNSLGLDPYAQGVSGFYLIEPLLNAAAHNTYLETISNKTNTLYLKGKEGLTEMVTYSYLESIRRLSEKFGWKDKEVMLAFDYTDEDFYGEDQGGYLHSWTCKGGVTAKFKFLTCSIVSDDIPEKIPLISIPIALGHYKSYAINYCLDKIKDFIGSIKLILFDRGFYDKDLMYELSQDNFSYLIFVPKHKDKQEILFPLKKGTKIAIHNELKVNKDKSTYKFENVLVFLKEIYDKKSEKNYDWVFATNVEDIELEEIIKIYKKRWRIETAFRVQDEATIKCKSKEMKIRYFIFMFQQMIQTNWMCYHKNEVSFKKFLIEHHELSKELEKKPKKGYQQRKRTIEPSR